MPHTVQWAYEAQASTHSKAMAPCAHLPQVAHLLDVLHVILGAAEGHHNLGALPGNLVCDIGAHEAICTEDGGSDPAHLQEAGRYHNPFETS